MKRLYTLLLTISFATVTTHAATKTVKYKVKSGDSLYRIAHNNNTTVTKLRKANGMKKSETLKMGKVIKVPKTVSSSTKKKKVVKLIYLWKNRLSRIRNQVKRQWSPRR